MNSEHSNEEEYELIDAILAGNPKKFDLLVQSHQGRVLGSMLAMLGNRHDAEDVTQDAFFTAFRKLDRFERRSSFSTWVHRIAFNLAIDHQRRMSSRGRSRQTTVEAAESSVIDREPSPSARLLDQETHAQILEALSQLDVERRNIIAMRDLQGMDYAQIAEVMDIPIGTVRSRLHRARIELREIMIRVGLMPDRCVDGPCESPPPVVERLQDVHETNTSIQWLGSPAIDKKGSV